MLCALIMGNGCFYLWRCFLMIVQIHKESSVIGNNVLWVGRVSRFACGQMDTGLVSLLPDRRLWGRGSCTVAETWGEVIITNNNPAGAPMYCNVLQCAPMYSNVPQCAPTNSPGTILCHVSPHSDSSMTIAQSFLLEMEMQPLWLYPFLC